MSQVKTYQPIIQRYNHIRSKKLTDSARGQVCTMGLPGCSYGTDTTVCCHANYQWTGKGTGIKSSDVFSADMCGPCHDTYDRRKPSNHLEDELEQYFWRAFVKTTNRRIAEGLITIAGAK